MKKAEYIDLTQDEADALIERVNNDEMTEQDRELFIENLRLLFWMQSEMIDSKLSIKRLRSLFGMKTEKKL